MAHVKDPVCGMTVDSSKAAANYRYAGQDYWFCSTHCQQQFVAAPARYTAAPADTLPAAGPQHQHHTPASAAIEPGEKAKDPICGMVVNKATALKSERGGRSYYFCSETCLRTFESPENELKSMKTRVTIAMTGVLALAVLRAGAFLGLATGATLLSWAPIPNLPWFTWGMWLFLLVTPVQFIGGWTFYRGAWNTLRTGNINMDFLIALGTSVAYFYSVVVMFFPDVLPVKVAERDVYFEVSAVIIAFVLLGRYMEEIIKKKSSAAVCRLLDLKPATAHVLRDGQEVEIPAGSIMVGETVVVKPGEKIATDGIVESGLDFGKNLVRINLKDAGSVDTLEATALAVSDAAAAIRQHEQGTDPLQHPHARRPGPGAWHPSVAGWGCARWRRAGSRRRRGWPGRRRS